MSLIKDADNRVLAASLMLSAMQTDSVEVLIPELLDLFRRHRILIPVPATVERIMLIGVVPMFAS